MATQCYYQGDFYYATVATAAGESPASAPDKWRRLDLPADIDRPVAEYAAGLLLAGDGQHDKDAALERRAQGMLDDRRFQTLRGGNHAVLPRVWTR